MVDSPGDVIVDTIIPNNLPGAKWLIIGFFVILGLITVGIVIWVFISIRKSKESWNVELRIRAEDKETGKLYLDPVTIKAKRIMLKNGLRLLYLQKEILGARLFPLLNHHTRPGVYDLVITADNRIFIVDGISGIDEQRKNLKVGLRYPGIDYSLGEINRDYAALNKAERRSDLLGMVKAAATAIIAIVILIMFIVGGKYWIEAKQIDSQIRQSEVQLFESINTNVANQEALTNGMNLLVDKLKDLLGTNNLRGELNTAQGT